MICVVIILIQTPSHNGQKLAAIGQEPLVLIYKSSCVYEKNSYNRTN